MNIKRRVDKVAPMKRRILAYVIDALIVSFLMALVYSKYGIHLQEPDVMSIIYSMDTSDANAMSEITAILMRTLEIYCIIYILYHTFFVWYLGFTIGKYLTKIKCVDASDFESKVSLKSSIIRAVLRLFSDLFFYIGFFPAFTNVNHQALHDRVANTVVVVVD